MLYTRRQFWISTAALAAYGKSYKPRLGVASYVWTQHFSRQKKSLAEGVEEMLAGSRRAGYRRIELMSGFFAPLLRETTFALLKQYKMALPSVYNGGPMHEEAGARKTIAETLEVAEVVRPAGVKAIVFNAHPKPRGARKSDQELLLQAQALEELGRQLHGRGLALYVHQHAPEMQEESREWRHQLRHTDPRFVQICLDIDWVKRGGQDVMTLLKEAAPRLRSLHLRTMRNGVWWEELADGDVDYRPVAAFLKQIGFQGDLWVELAWEPDTRITRSLEESLRRSREYAQKVFAS